MTWISVEERLPDDDTLVLFNTEEQGLVVGSVDHDDNGLCFRIGNQYISWDYDFNYDCTITHWMPLPEPPNTNT